MINSALAQIICSMAGHKDLRVALFICNVGFKVFWRHMVGRDINDDPVFSYFSFPRGPALESHGIQGLLILRRVLFEIVKVCAVLGAGTGRMSSAEAESSPTAQKSSTGVTAHFATSQSGQMHRLFSFEVKDDSRLRE